MARLAVVGLVAPQCRSRGCSCSTSRPQGSTSPDVDLMAALTASMESAKAARGATGDATVHDLPQKRAGKNTPAKTATKKAAAKKATAKKTTGRKPRSA
ncbi:hypothetical protein GT350_05645 [Streptomyces sp. SID1034]|nr:hypothetical protein [Streptomyces sp. SID1034]